MMPFPFHHVIAKPTTFVLSNYYGCDPYNTVAAAEVRQRIIRATVPAQMWDLAAQARYMK